VQEGVVITKRTGREKRRDQDFQILKDWRILLAAGRTTWMMRTTARTISKDGSRFSPPRLAVSAEEDLGRMPARER
jgi:hypothetical protein